MGFNISFGNEQYVPFQPGKGSQLLPKEGAFKVVVQDIEEGKAATSGNDKLVWHTRVDDDEGNGLRLVNHMAVSGEYEAQGKKRQNIANLQEALFSLYSNTEGSDEAALTRVNALLGKSLPSSALIEKLKGQTFFVLTRARSFVGTNGDTIWTSEITSFISKTRYEEMKPFRKALPDEALAPRKAAAPAQTQAANGQASGAVATPAPATSDPMAIL